MLKLYDEKKNTEKISAIIAEMKRYKNITMTAGKFGQDNRDWLVDKEHHTISQSLSSIRYIPKKAAQDLYRVGQMTKKVYETDEDDVIAILEGREQRKIEKIVPAFDCFTDLLRELQMNTCLDTRQIKILIELGYFEQFGGSAKLMKVYEEFFNGSMKLTKTVKSFVARLEASRCLEESLSNESLSIQQVLNSELSNIGLCLSVDAKAPSNLYFVKEIDAKYGIKTVLYSIQRGTTGMIRFRKDEFEKKPLNVGDVIKLVKFNKSPRYTYKNGERAILPGAYDIWAKEYTII